jgi:PEGA domain
MTNDHSVLVERQPVIQGRQRTAGRGAFCTGFAAKSAGIRVAGAAFMRTALALPIVLGSLCLTVAAAQFSSPPIQYPYRYATAESDLRILVKPTQASVYVDGYFAGKVDEFDGAFQRLHVEPGQHDITIYLAGYRSLKQHLYLSSRSTRKIEGTLEPLAPGESLEQPPVPLDPAEREEAADDRNAPQPPRPPRR